MRSPNRLHAVEVCVIACEFPERSETPLGIAERMLRGAPALMQVAQIGSCRISML